MLGIASDQPTFLPWAGYWHKAMAVDVMIHSIGVPVSYGARDHYHNRVRLAGSWLTLPIAGPTDGVPFKDVRFDPLGLPKIVRSLRNNFGKKTPHRDCVNGVIQMIEHWQGDNLLEYLNGELIRGVSHSLEGVKCYTVRDVEVPDPAQSKTQRLIARVRRFTKEPVAYYMGRGALAYMDVELMREHGFKLFLQTLDPAIRDETVLQLTAIEADATQTIRALGTWEEMT